MTLIAWPLLGYFIIPPSCTWHSNITERCLIGSASLLVNIFASVSAYNTRDPLLQIDESLQSRVFRNEGQPVPLSRRRHFVRIMLFISRCADESRTSLKYFHTSVQKKKNHFMRCCPRISLTFYSLFQIESYASLPNEGLVRINTEETQGEIQT